MDAAEAAYARFREAPPDSAAYAWAVPEPALPATAGADDPVLSAAQVAQWRDHGWLAVDGIWPAPLVSAAAAAAAELFATPKGAARGNSKGNFPNFPYDYAECDSLNQATLHPRPSCLVHKTISS